MLVRKYTWYNDLYIKSCITALSCRSTAFFCNIQVLIRSNRKCCGGRALLANWICSPAAVRDLNWTAQNFFEILLAIPYSAALQKISIFENAALVRGGAHVYTQVCFANLRLNGTRYFSVPFKLGQSGSAALPLPRIPPFFIRLYTIFLFA